MKNRREGLKIYKHIIQGKKWHELRNRYLADHPMCEECERRGILDSRATEVHHKTPIGMGQYRGDMERLAYDVNNLEALCHECHLMIHRHMRERRRIGRTMREMSSDVEEFLRGFGISSG